MCVQIAQAKRCTRSVMKEGSAWLRQAAPNPYKLGRNAQLRSEAQSVCQPVRDGRGGTRGSFARKIRFFKYSFSILRIDLLQKSGMIQFEVVKAGDQVES